MQSTPNSPFGSEQAAADYAAALAALSPADLATLAQMTAKAAATIGYKAAAKAIKAAQQPALPLDAAPLETPPAAPAYPIISTPQAVAMLTGRPVPPAANAQPAAKPRTRRAKTAPIG